MLEGLAAVFWPTIFGILNGIGIAGLGYAKRIQEGEFPDFDEKKFAQTCIVGGIVGGIAGHGGMTYLAAEHWVMSSGAIVLIEYTKKAAYRLLKRGY